MFRADTENTGKVTQKCVRLLLPKSVVLLEIGEQGRIVPELFPVGPPEARKAPARQRFTGVPLPLPEVEQAARCKFRLEARQHLARQHPLAQAYRRSIPFVTIAIIDRYKGRLPPHRQADISLRQFLVHLLSQAVDPLPSFVTVWQGDPRLLVDPRHLHRKIEFDLGVAAETSGERRGRRLAMAYTPPGYAPPQSVAPMCHPSQPILRPADRPPPRRADQ